MKKILFISVVVVIMLAMNSCSPQPDELSSGTIEDLTEDLLEQKGLNQDYVQIKVGYYECNSFQTRRDLFRLQQAGLITYKAEIFDWWNKIVRIEKDWWGEYSQSVSFWEDAHIFVTVALTDKGKKLMVDSIPVPEPVIDKDMKQPEVDFSTFPENKVDYKESWPKLPYPTEADQSQVRADAIDTTYTEKETMAAVETVSNRFEEIEDYISDNQKELQKMKEDNKVDVMSLDYATSQAYEAAKEKEKTNTQVVTLKTSKLKVKKARFIQIYDNEEGFRCAKAEVIVESDDVTDAGRVLQGKVDGIRFCAPVELIFYYDKGWILQTKNLDFSKESSLGILVSSEDVAAPQTGTPVGEDGSSKAEREEEASFEQDPEMDY